MKMTNNEFISCKSKLQDIFPGTVNLYPNGIFNALDIEADIKDKLLKELKTLGFVKNLNAAYYRNDNGKKLFQINGLIDYNQLTEAIELHDTLNPKIWNDDKELIEELRVKIIEIVKYFTEQLAEDGVILKVDDIYILGSNANFNYNDSSDLDVHIIADESFDCDLQHLEIIYNAYKTLFNKKYDITFNGINVELYVENKDKLNNVSAGIYSLKDGWIKQPIRYEIPDIDDVALEKLVADWENRYLDIIDNPTVDAIDDYISNIYDLRKTGLQQGSEFALGNLTFKEIRKLGYLDNLKELRAKLQSELLSI